MHEEIMTKVVEIIAAELKIAQERITSGLSVGDLPQWGSMAQMSIVSTLQKEFGVKIPLEDLFDIVSVSDLVGAVEKLKEQGK